MRPQMSPSPTSRARDAERLSTNSSANERTAAGPLRKSLPYDALGNSDGDAFKQIKSDLCVLLTRAARLLVVLKA